MGRRTIKAAAAAKAKRVDNPIDRNSVFWFVAFLFSALLAFWPSYFSQPLSQPNWRLHTHGIAMTLWVVMLITQAHLIRTGRKDIFAYFPSLIDLVPKLNGTPLVQILGFICADVLLLALVFWDRRAKRRTHVFAIALAILIAYHASVLILYDKLVWRSFGAWFASLPLS
jgi:hypothetical protein